MLNPQRDRLLAVCLVVALFGCSNGGDSGPEGPVTLTKIPVLDGYLDSLCTFMVHADAYPTKLSCAQTIMEGSGRTLMDLDSAIGRYGNLPSRLGRPMCRRGVVAALHPSELRHLVE